MKQLSEQLRDILYINESRTTDTIKTLACQDDDDFEAAQQYIYKLMPSALFKLTDKFFSEIISEVGEDISKIQWDRQAGNDPKRGKSVKGIQFIPGYTKFSHSKFPEGFDENDMEIASVVALCEGPSKKICILTLIEHPGGKLYMHYIPLRKIIDNPGKKIKITGAISEYVMFDKLDVADIICVALLSYMSKKVEANKLNPNKPTVNKPVVNKPTVNKPVVNNSVVNTPATNQSYQTIQKFKAAFPEREIYDILVELGIKNKSDRLIFNKKLFDDRYKEMGNDWNSYISGLYITKYHQVGFEVYIAGDSSDETELVLYDNFTKTYGDVEVKGHFTKHTAVYTEKVRLMIFNKIAELLSDAVDGNDVFY